MTPRQIQNAASPALTERIAALSLEAHRCNGLTRKGWSEFHALLAEQRSRTSLTNKEA